MGNIVGKAIVVFAAFGLTAPAVAAAPGDPEALIAAAESVKTKLDGTAATGEAPLLGNSGAALVRTAFDADTIRAMPLDSQLIGRACSAIGLAIVAYVEFGTRKTGGGAALDTFLVKIQAEMAASATAANLCLGRGFQAVEPIVAAMSASDQANIAAPLHQMHDGAVQTINGTLETIVNPAFNAANRAAMAAALVESAPPIAASFTPADRAAMRTAILGHVASAPADVRARLNALVAIYAKPDCNSLCKALSGAH